MSRLGPALGCVLVAGVVAAAGPCSRAPEPAPVEQVARATGPSGDWGRGPSLFAEVCAGCHAAGGGSGQGPDLKGVTERRTAEWLERFLRDPQGMSHVDPIGRELLREADGQAMPPPNLSRQDIRDILTYLAHPGGAVLSRALPVPTHPPKTGAYHTGEHG